MNERDFGMSTQKELLTIVIPAYNVQNYIEQCLDSLIQQTLRNHRVILVDDGSTDQMTSVICRKYAEEYPDWITYLRQENRGLGAARNTGLKYADTEYVAFLDSDDWLNTKYVETVTKELSKYRLTQIDLVFTLPVIYDSLTSGYQDWFDKKLFQEIFCSGDPLVSAAQERRLYHLEPNACRRIYRTDFLKKLNFAFPEGVKWEDVYPHFFLLHNAGYCLGIREVGFYYRINTPNQITASTGKGRLDVVKVFAQTLDYLFQEDCEDEVVLSAIYMLVSFSEWSISKSNVTVRGTLVRQLSNLFRLIPKKQTKLYIKQCPSRKDRMFVRLIRRKHLSFLMDDYLVQSTCVGLLKKLR